MKISETKKRKYHVVSITDGCWQYLGSAKTHKKALGILWEFIYEVTYDDNIYTVETDYDDANLAWEQVTVTVAETEDHSKLEYPVIIFYEDKIIKEEK